MANQIQSELHQLYEEPDITNVGKPEDRCRGCQFREMTCTPENYLPASHWEIKQKVARY